MATFQYQVRDRGGKAAGGLIEAPNIREAAAKLRDEGFLVTALRAAAESKSGAGPKVAKKRVGLRDLMLFTRQFAVMVKAGLNLVNSLNLLATQTENKYLGSVILEVRRAVEGGQTLHEALAKYPAVFPPIFINMVEAGEAGGMLETVLQRLNEHFERDFLVQKKVRGAMVYPAVISLVAVLVVTGLMTMVLPTFKQMFDDAGMELPGITKMLMALSDFTVHYWYILLGTLVAGVFGFRLYRKTPRGRYRIDKFLINLIVVGPAIRQIVLARFSRTLATLLNSGILITNGLEIVERAVANGVIAEAAAAARVDLTRGGGLAKPLADTGVFPALFTQMIAVGEETGELPEMLTQVADYYEKEAEYAIGTLTALIEPLIIIVLGAVVGFIVIAIAIPMLDINSGATMLK